MSVEVAPFEGQASESVEWDAFVRAQPDGSPFHLVAWRRTVDAAFGHRACYLVARRGAEIEGVLPLFEVRGPLRGRALVSVPYGVYGGVCAASDEARHRLVEAAAALGRARRASYVELRHRGSQGLGLPVKSRYVTFARPIAATDEENARAIPGKQRRMTRQGERHGLRAEVGREHVDAVYDIYARNVRDLGSPVFPRRLFQAALDAFGKDCAILTVWRGERLIAGVLTLFYEDQVLPYYGAALPEARQWAANDFMYWELMRYAARAGYRVFDFGRSRVGTGAYAFKRHWGFESAPLPYAYVLLRRRSVPDVSPSNRRFGLAVRVWRRMPLPLANRLGPALTRYLP